MRAGVIDDTCAHYAPVFLTRRGCRVAAVIGAEYLERFTQAAEDLTDIVPFSPERAARGGQGSA